VSQFSVYVTPTALKEIKDLRGLIGNLTHGDEHMMDLL